MIKPYLFVASSNGKGRGVFTNENIRSKSIIEISPVIVLPAKDRKTVDQTLLHDYIFEWGETRRQACIALGYVSLYNHSFTSNWLREHGSKQLWSILRSKISCGNAEAPLSISVQLHQTIRDEHHSRCHYS